MNEGPYRSNIQQHSVGFHGIFRRMWHSTASTHKAFATFVDHLPTRCSLIFHYDGGITDNFHKPNAELFEVDVLSTTRSDAALAVQSIPAYVEASESWHGVAAGPRRKTDNFTAPKTMGEFGNM